MATRRTALHWFLGTTIGSMCASVVYPVLRYIVPPDVPEATRHAMADACLDTLLKSRTNDSKLYLARYLYRLQWNLPGAKDDLAEALKLAPADPQVMLYVAQDALNAAKGAHSRD